REEAHGTASARAPTASKQREREAEQGRGLLYASAEVQGFFLALHCLQGLNVHAVPDSLCLSEAAPAGRARNPEIRGDCHVSSVVDEMAKPVVVALLRAPRSRHADIIRRSLTPLNSEDNVGGPPTRLAASVTTTRAVSSRMSARTARRAA